MLFSEMALDKRLQCAVNEAGFSTPTPIQEKAIPAILKGKDVIATAATGTGKTAAFILPLIQRLLEKGRKRGSTSILVITPTRELAEQIHDVTRELGGHTGASSAVIYGGVGFEPQKKALRDGRDLVICCPGRFIDHMEKGHTRLGNVMTVVLDEADRMLDMGFLPDIRKILDKLPKHRQNLLFSATFDPELNKLIARYINKPVRISVDTEAPVRTVDHCFYPVPGHLKTGLVLELLRFIGRRSVLIFTRTKHRANRLCDKIRRAGFESGALHSNRSQNQRKTALDGFRSGKIGILVATDIAARGLDIAKVSHVINFDIPASATTYIHRIGRTGRAERSGDAFTLVSPEDSPVVREIERSLGYTVERKTIKGFAYLAPRSLTSMPARGPGSRVNRQRRRFIRQPVRHPHA